MREYERSHLQIITTRVRSTGKVMFWQASVCPPPWTVSGPRPLVPCPFQGLPLSPVQSSVPGPAGGGGTPFRTGHGGTPLVQDRRGTPQTGQGVNNSSLPQTEQGVNKWCYAAGSTPLAVTQEDFLVHCVITDHVRSMSVCSQGGGVPQGTYPLTRSWQGEEVPQGTYLLPSTKVPTLLARSWWMGYPEVPTPLSPRSRYLPPSQVLPDGGEEVPQGTYPQPGPNRGREKGVHQATYPPPTHPG